MSGALDHIFRRIVGRALLALLIAAFAVVAICYFTAAGTVALDAQYGTLYARIIMGAIYAGMAIAGAIWWAALSWRTSVDAPPLSTQRKTHITMLVEAVMLGYELARKGNRAV
jgi:type VI protein secretion system component VasK